ncbi:hypothetical protein Tco_0713162, partial [Tanacetum coccineum]
MLSATFSGGGDDEGPCCSTNLVSMPQQIGNVRVGYSSKGRPELGMLLLSRPPHLLNSFKSDDYIIRILGDRAVGGRHQQIEADSIIGPSCSHQKLLEFLWLGTTYEVLL